MNIQSLPPAILVEIFNYLPFKDRVRNARVSKLFQSVSEAAITEMEELTVSEELGFYALSGGLKSFLEKISPKLQRIIVDRCDYTKLAKLILGSLLDFPFPRVVDIRFHREIMKNQSFDLIKLCPNLKYLTYNCGYHMEIPDEIGGVGNLEKLKIQTEYGHGHLLDIDFKSGKLDMRHCSDNWLTAIVKIVSNMKEISLKNATGNVEKLDELFKRSPKLESIVIHFDRGIVDFEKLSYFWRLSALEQLVVNSVSITDAFFLKIAYHFPELEKIHLSGIVEITEEAVTALSVLSNLSSFKLESEYGNVRNSKMLSGTGFEQFSAFENLKELVLDQFPFPPASFVKIVRSCSKLVAFKIYSVIGVHSPETAAEILNSFTDLKGDDLSITIKDQTICSMGPGERVGVWESNEVNIALKKLKKKIILSVGNSIGGSGPRVCYSSDESILRRQQLGFDCPLQYLERIQLMRGMYNSDFD